MDVDKEFEAMTGRIADDEAFTVTLAWGGGSKTVHVLWCDVREFMWYVCGIMVGLRLARKD